MSDDRDLPRTVDECLGRGEAPPDRTRGTVGE